MYNSLYIQLKFPINDMSFLKKMHIFEVYRQNMHDNVHILSIFSKYMHTAPTPC
jgi:hypothetical protein